MAAQRAARAQEREEAMSVITYTLNDPSGQFKIVGSEIRVAGPLTPGTYPVTITAQNTSGWSRTIDAEIVVGSASVFVLKLVSIF